MTSEQRRVRSWFKRLKRAQRHHFPAVRKRVDAPSRHGVYVISDKSDRVLHVGRTVKGSQGLAQRLHNHLTNASSFSLRYLRGHGARLRKGYKYRYVEIGESRLRALVEYYAIGCLCPAHLGDGSPEKKA